ncbi:C3H1-type domain-containing protein [Aphelenchoides fujianensis]|nr:C3H1-type domain-containing protein [Aphelenchoides fujianensis]
MADGKQQQQPQEREREHHSGAPLKVEDAWSPWFDRSFTTRRSWREAEIEVLARSLHTTTLGMSLPDPARRPPAACSLFVPPTVREEFGWTDEERANRMREKRLQEKRKTSLCNQFSRTGTCEYGDRCRFAHGVGELRLMPEPKNYKTKLCRNFERDQFCAYGERCQFIHRRKEGGPSSLFPR